MFESIGRSWELVKASWRILSEDRKLLIFPLLSGIVTLLVVASFILPLFISAVVLGQVPGGEVPWYAFLFLFYVVTYFVAIFFNAALVSCVHSLLQGKETSLGDGISHAVRHVGSILVWALVAATVGIILRFIGERGGIIGRIAVAIVGGIWSFVTIFVVPILVIEDKGVADAVKESVALFRKTWGESVVGSVSIGIIFGAVAALGVFVVLAAGLLGGLSGFLLALALLMLLITVLAVISSAMQGIFVVALYTYAKTGTVPQGFGKGVIEQAFVPKGPVFGAGNI